MEQLTLMGLTTALALMTLLGAPSLSLAQDVHIATLDAINEIPTCLSSGHGTFTATMPFRFYWPPISLPPQGVVI